MSINSKYDYNNKTDILMDISIFQSSSCIYNQGLYSLGNVIVIGNLCAGFQQSVKVKIVTKFIHALTILVQVINVMMNFDYAIRN